MELLLKVKQNLAINNKLFHISFFNIFTVTYIADENGFRAEGN